MRGGPFAFGLVSRVRREADGRFSRLDGPTGVDCYMCECVSVVPAVSSLVARVWLTFGIVSPVPLYF